MLALWLVAAQAQTPLDVNAATLDQLDALPGIGPAKARALVLWRQDQGPCKALSDLEAVPGWGPATLAALRRRIACGAGQVKPQSATTSRRAVPEGLALHSNRIDINAAGPYRLATLPGISLARAQDIVAHRKAHGPFKSCKELAVLPGVGAATVAVLDERCTVQARQAR
ncbi:MAG: helix-hairpin-helix domain-containing protein [Myxococcota bacterium]